MVCRSRCPSCSARPRASPTDRPGPNPSSTRCARRQPSPRSSTSSRSMSTRIRSTASASLASVPGSATPASPCASYAGMLRRSPTVTNPVVNMPCGPTDTPHLDLAGMARDPKHRPDLTAERGGDGARRYDRRSSLSRSHPGRLTRKVACRPLRPPRRHGRPRGRSAQRTGAITAPPHRRARSNGRRTPSPRGESLARGSPPQADRDRPPCPDRTLDGSRG